MTNGEVYIILILYYDYYIFYLLVYIYTTYYA